MNQSEGNDVSAPASTYQPQQNTGSDSTISDNFIEFQVDRVGHPRRRLRLSGQSYTFGSGDGCSVRLEDASVRKTHAILIRQDDRLLVRGYGIAILVNGIRVTEAWLEEQDNLQLGDYTLTLLKGVGSFQAPVAPKAPQREVPSLSRVTSRGSASPFAESARHFVTMPSENVGHETLIRGRQMEPSSPSCRLSFADGMRLVSKSPTHFEPEDLFTRFRPSAPAVNPAVSKTRALDRADAARIRRLEKLHEQSSQRVEAALESSVASTHAVETLSDKLESLFSQLSDESDRRHSDALQRQLETASEKHDAQQRAFVQLTDRVSVLETAVDKANKEARLYREKHEEALLRIQQLEAQLKETIFSHGERQASWELEAASLRDSIDDLTRQLLTAQSSLTEQKETASSLQQQLDDANAINIENAAQHKIAIAEQIRQRKELSSEHALEKQNLQSEHTRLQDQLAAEVAQHEAALSLQHAAHQETMAVEVQRNADSAAQITQLERELSDVIANHRSGQTAWEAEAKELNATIEQIGHQLALCEAQLSKHRERADKLQTELDNSATARTNAQAEDVDRTERLNQELERAQRRLSSLQDEQTNRQNTWQREREELEYKIAHQAAELSQISALRASAIPQEDSAVANRLAARLQAEVNRLHQEQQLDSTEHAQLFASFPNELAESKFDASDTTAPIEQTFLLAETSSEELNDLDENASTFQDEPTETFMADELGQSEIGVEADPAPHVVETAQSEDPTREVNDFVPVDVEINAFTPPENADVTIEQTFVFDQESRLSSNGEFSTSSLGFDHESDEPHVPESVYQSVTKPDSASDYRTQLQVDETSFDSDAEADEVSLDDSDTMERPQSEDLAFSDDADSESNDDDAQGSPISVPHSFGSFNEADWEAGPQSSELEMSQDESSSSPWGENDDEAYSGLAAELIGEFNRSAPQADSFKDLSESSAYDPTEVEFNASESLGLMDEASVEYPYSLPSSEYENAIDRADLSSDATEVGNHMQSEEENIGSQTQVMPTDGFSTLKPASLLHDHFDDTDVENNTSSQWSQSTNAPDVQESEPEKSYFGSIQEQGVPEQPQSETPTVAVSSHHQDDIEHDDDSIEAYMNRLLKRMHGDDAEPQQTPTPKSANPVETPVASRVVQSQTDESSQVVDEARQEVMHESEYVPRRSAPERSGNMEAMRELANNSARQAIAKSVRNRQRSQSYFKLFLSGIFIIGSGIFAVLAQRQLMPHLLASAACVVLAVYWGLSGLKLLKGKTPPASTYTESTPLPATVPDASAVAPTP